jgi:hypothetical protein
MGSPANKAGELAAQGIYDWIAAHYGPLFAALAAGSVWATVALFVVLVGWFTLLLRQGDSEKSHEREQYQAWRASYADGGWFTEVYARELTWWLDRLDRFLGDYGKAHLSAFPHFLGLGGATGRRYPLWTGASYDRCLLLALIYPALTISLIWTISGEQGSAEKALGLTANASTLARAAFALAEAGFGLAIWRFWATRKGWILAVGSACCAGAFAIAGSFTFSIVVAAAAWGAIAGAGAPGVAVAVAFAVPFTLGSGGIAATAGAAALAAAGAIWTVSPRAVRNERQGVMLTLFSVGMICGLLAFASQAMHVPTWKLARPVLLFLGLVTLINAPFDWVAIGLTRALLRRGVEVGGWTPAVLALIDFALAFILVALLAAALVIGVQAFDYLSVEVSGAQRFGSVHDTLVRLRAEPQDPEFWWIYATLFSTFIPSVLNLCLAGVSLTRGIPPLSQWIAGRMPETHAPPGFTVAYLSAVMAGQTMVGILLPIAALAGLGWLVFHDASPVGSWFLDYAQAIDRLEIPRQVNELVARP